MNALFSNIFVVLYIAATLLLRFYLEPQLKGNYLISVALGLFALLFLWALIKSKIIRPSLMGLDKLVNKNTHWHIVYLPCQIDFNMVQKRRELRWAIFWAGVIAVNYPILSIFNKPLLIFGLPSLYVYVFGLWVLLIVLTLRLSKKQSWRWTLQLL